MRPRLADRLRGLKRRLHDVFHPDAHGRELEREMEFHLRMETARHMEEGLDPAAARRAALLAFAGVDRYVEQTRTVRRFAWVERMGRDLHHAMRGWIRAPLLALTIVATLALALGSATAMFAIVRVVLLDALPYPQGERLVRIYHAIGSNRWNLSVADFLAIEEQQTHFGAVAAHASAERTLVTSEGAERVRVRPVTQGWFDALGIRAAAGRTFVDSDAEAGSLVVVSDGFARRQFGGAAAATGQRVRLDGEDYMIVGVLPHEVGPLEERFELFPLLRTTVPTRKGPFTLTLVGRLAGGSTPAVAEAELQAINSRIFPIWQDGWQDRTATYGVMPLEEFVAGRVRTLLLVLATAVLMILLVAATNVASLITARMMQRRVELATRAAIGASRRGLTRLIVSESAALALAGAAAGLVVAAVALHAIRIAGPDLMPRAGYVRLDAPVLLFTSVVTALTVLFCGLLPALQLIRGGDSLALTIRSGASTITGSAAGHRARRMLVAVQFAVALPLLAGAVLLTATFLRLQAVNPGFAGDDVLTMRISRPPDAGGAEDRFWEALLDRTRTMPGVASAGLSSDPPPRGAGNINNFDLLDRPTPPGESEPLAVWLVATPGYFETMQIPLLRGRHFDTRDNDDAEAISAIVDRTWAENMYPGEDVIGRRFYEGGCKSEECAVVEVIGVVADVRYLGLDDAQHGTTAGTVYVPHSQWPSSTMHVFVRTAGGDPLSLAPAIRAAVRELDPATPVSDLTTADRLVNDALAAPRNIALIVLGFGAVAVMLAIMGIYGVMNYFVQEHRREIAIRLALGGSTAGVLRLVVLHGMRPVFAGVAIGCVLALTGTGFMQKLLHGVQPNDPATVSSVAAVMLVTAVLACTLPAVRTMKLDPAVVLRQE